jgi:hypothetical protein
MDMNKASHYEAGIPLKKNAVRNFAKQYANQESAKELADLSCAYCRP